MEEFGLQQTFPSLTLSSKEETWDTLLNLQNYPQQIKEAMLKGSIPLQSVIIGYNKEGIFGHAERIEDIQKYYEDIPGFANALRRPDIKSRRKLILDIKRKKKLSY